MAKTSPMIRVATSILLLIALSVIPAPAQTTQLQLPRPPATMTSIPERADYVMTHFWDSLNASGGSSVLGTDSLLEQCVADFLSLLPHGTPQGRQTGFANAIAAISPDHDALLRFNSLIEKYLDEPESPMFSEDAYIDYLSALTSAGVLDKYESVRPEYQLQALLKNRPGTTATDITYIDRSGQSASLHSTTAPLLLLILYDPECDHCAHLMQELSADTTLCRAVDDGTLAILAIFADGETDAWATASQSLPVNWLGGLDRSGIQENELYTIRDLPSLYLLDSEKTVLLKNPSLPEIKAFIHKE